MVDTIRTTLHLTPAARSTLDRAAESTGSLSAAANEILTMATLDALLKVAAALPGRSEDLAARTGLNRATIFRVLAELRQAPPDGLGMTIQAPDNEIQDWGILNPARLPGRDAT